MPQSKESRQRYTKDWHKISLRIRERAGYSCQECGAARGEFRTSDTYEIVPEEEYAERSQAALQAALQAHFNVKRKPPINEALRNIYENTGEVVSLRSGCSGKLLYAAVQTGKDYSHMISSARTTSGIVKVAVQVHHIDEDQSNNNDSNLLCLCGRCHMLKHAQQFDKLFYPTKS